MHFTPVFSFRTLLSLKLKILFNGDIIFKLESIGSTNENDYREM